MAADAAYVKLVLLACNLLQCGGFGRAHLPAPAPLHAPTPAPPPPRARRRRRHRAQAPSLAAGPTHRQDQGQHHPVQSTRFGDVSKEIKRVRKQMEEDEQLASLMPGQNLRDDQAACERKKENSSQGDGDGNERKKEREAGKDAYHKDEQRAGELARWDGAAGGLAVAVEEVGGGGGVERWPGSGGVGGERWPGGARRRSRGDEGPGGGAKRSAGLEEPDGGWRSAGLKCCCAWVFSPTSLSGEHRAGELAIRGGRGAALFDQEGPWPGSMAHSALGGCVGPPSPQVGG